MPAVQKVKFGSDSIGAVPILLFSEARFDEYLEMRRRQMIDIIFDDNFEQLNNIRIARGLKKTIIIPCGVASRHFTA
jgi:hypothetical protein